MSDEKDDILQSLKKYLKKEVVIQAFDLIYKGVLKNINKNLTVTLKDQDGEMILPIERIESIQCID